MFQMSFVRFSILMGMVILTSVCGFAQTSQGTVAGVVTDQSEAAVPGASVNAKNNTGSDDRTVMTGANGEYRIDAVTPSVYTITVTKQGFSKKEIKNVVVTASVVTSVNAQLAVGDVSQTVTVEGGAATVQTESGEISATITQQEISQLPIVTGNPIDLVLTQPGMVTVATRDGRTSGEGFSVDGLRPRANNFLIDGFDNNDYGLTGQALQSTNLEAVKEVSIQTNSYAPEFGRGGASVTNVIYKNGTNLWHGAGWDRYSAAGLNAIPVELKNQGLTVNPNFVNNVFGFDIAGPIIKNKLFILGSSQWNHLNEDEEGGQFNIPTAAGVTSLQALGTNPNVAILLASLGGLTAPTATGSINIGNRPGCGSPCLIQIGPVIRTPKGISRAYEWITRGDYTASDNDIISARFIGARSSLSPDFFANPNALPTQDTFQGGPVRNFGILWTHVVSPTKVNELRFSAQQIDFTFGALPSTASSPLAATPNITIAGLGTTYGGLNPTFPQGRGHNVYQYQDAFSWTVGTHSLKMGADLIHVNVNDIIPFNSIGTVSFTAGGDCSAIGLTTCTGLANFVDNFTGPAGSAGKQFGSPYLSFPQTMQAYYFQDTWKMRPNLTMTYGVRYEYSGTPLNSLPYPTTYGGVLGVISPLTLRIPQQPDKNNFGPRVGIAYTPHFGGALFGQDKTVFRAGFGTFYDELFSNIGDNSAGSTPNALGGVLTAGGGRGTGGALQLVPAVTATLNPLSAVTSVVNNIVNPLTYQWHAGFERTLPAEFILKVAYVGTRGERLYVGEQLNPGIDSVRIDPARGSIVARTNLGNSIYHGLDVSVDRSLGRGFIVRGAYTWSKALDNMSDIFISSGTASQPQNLFNQSLEKGPSAFDRRQRGVLTFLYQTPTFKASSDLGKVLSWPVRDWQVSGIFSWQTGAPETITLSGYDQNGDLNSGNDRPNLSNPNAPINYSPACLASPTCITGIGQINPNGSLTDWNTNAPGTPSQFRYIATNVLGIGPNGNLGRNTFFNPGRQDYSLALQRNFKIPRLEGHQLEFRAEAFDVFNHPNAGGGTTQDGSSVPGISGNINNTATFNNKDVTFEGGRTMQLWLRYRF
jgi:Carboxypeptidase regulatory-like domain/TonB-dependent Receptor Plug Domain